MTFDLSIEEEIDMNVLPEKEVDLSFKEQYVDGDGDYRTLVNKPSINGERLVDNYDEIDPTVPRWAKHDFKPTYTASEVGAMSSDSEVSFTDLKAVWDSVFSD